MGALMGTMPLRRLQAWQRRCEHPSKECDLCTASGRRGLPFSDRAISLNSSARERVEVEVGQGRSPAGGGCNSHSQWGVGAGLGRGRTWASGFSLCDWKGAAA